MKSACTALLSILLLTLLLPMGSALGQGRSSEVVIQTTKTAYRKTDILVNMPDVLSGGRASVQSAELVHAVIYSDMDYSGLLWRPVSFRRFVKGGCHETKNDVGTVARRHAGVLVV